MCVLFVEDDLVTRVVMGAALQQIGYEVEEVRDGEAGFAVFDRCPERFCVLVVEARLPGNFDGRAVADYVRARRPDLPVIVTGGMDARSASWLRNAGFSSLPKPYRPHELLRLVGLLTKSAKE